MAGVPYEVLHDLFDYDHTGSISQDDFDGFLAKIKKIRAELINDKKSSSIVAGIFTGGLAIAGGAVLVAATGPVGLIVGGVLLGSGIGGSTNVGVQGLVYP